MKILDNLYNDYDIESYSFDNFFVKEIIAVKKCYNSILFLLPTGCKNGKY